MITYIDIISRYYPEIQVELKPDGDPSNYEDIVWKDKKIEKSNLDPKFLKLYKEQKIEILSEQAKQEIISGFESNALGTTHVYDSNLEDQVNLIGSIISVANSIDEQAADGTWYACRDDQNLKSYKWHTASEIVQVGQDAKRHKFNVLQYFNDLKTQISNALTKEEVDSFTWDY